MYILPLQYIRSLVLLLLSLQYMHVYYIIHVYDQIHIALQRYTTSARQ
jgi:hypothetical protein